MGWFDALLLRAAISKVGRPVASRAITTISTTSTLANLNKQTAGVRRSLAHAFLNLEQLDPNLYRSYELVRGRKSMEAVYGGQVIGHSLSAASATVSPEFIPHSLHSYFIKSGTVMVPILYQIDRLRDGRSFCTRFVKATQNGDAIFTAQISFHKRESDSIKHEFPIPTVVGPENLKDYHTLMAEATSEENSDIQPIHRAIIQHKMAEFPATFTKIFEVRPIDAERFLFKKLDSSLNSRFYFWLRAKEDIGEDLGLQRCLAAYISDSMMMEMSLWPHLGRQFLPSMVFSLDHSIWFHKPEFRMDRWILFEIESPCAAGSRAFSTARLWTREGKLMLSVAQEGLVRARL
ncbi:Acyl-coenzyme A thioesterase 8 [Toxocara canis]|uniref:Acyl-coenzyme A thioesterase 8 n=1 Tax=Toxocara canis TaxID=6265 RepID=A0A0B2UP14_TOXCA|nr:Acyl-coenzyme A thioesterase 8 [Toxocara canis]